MTPMVVRMLVTTVIISIFVVTLFFLFRYVLLGSRAQREASRIMRQEIDHLEEINRMISDARTPEDIDTIGRLIDDFARSRTGPSTPGLEILRGLLTATRYSAKIKDPEVADPTGIEWEGDLKTIKQLVNCPVCDSKLGRKMEIVHCADCNVPHHKQCWVYNGECAIFGCESRRRRNAAGRKKKAREKK